MSERKTLKEINNQTLSWKKEAERRELRRNIIIGAILRYIHKQQGTEAYLLQIVEPYLRKSDRQLFGLPF